MSQAQQRQRISRGFDGGNTNSPARLDCRPWRFAWMLLYPDPTGPPAHAYPVSVWLRQAPGGRPADLTLSVGVARLVDVGVVDATESTIWTATPNNSEYIVDVITDQEPIAEGGVSLPTTDPNGALIVSTGPNGPTTPLQVTGATGALFRVLAGAPQYYAHHWPPAGTVASIVLPAASGQFRNTIRSLVAMFGNNNLAGGDTRVLQIFDGATLIEGSPMFITAAAGNIDRLTRDGIAIQGSPNTPMTVNFSGIYAGTTQAITLSYSQETNP